MADAARVVETAVAALVHGEIARHLDHVSDDVRVQFNENPPIQGKMAYEAMLCHVIQGEAVVSFRIAGQVTEPDGGVTVRVDQVHQLDARNRQGQSVAHRETVSSSYTVRDNVIVEVKLALLGGPNRVYRYP